MNDTNEPPALPDTEPPYDEIAEFPKDTPAWLNEIHPTEEQPAQDIPGTEPDDTFPAYKLGDKYDPALLGATIQGQFAYSLTKLVEIETSEERSAAAAQEFIAQQVVEVTRQWGPGSPVFIDDSLLPKPLEVALTIPEDRPRIIIPR